MPLLLAIAGAMLIIAAMRNSQAALGSAVASDAGAFLAWAGAIGGAGALGYIPGLREPSRMLVALILIALVLANYKAIFANFQSAATGGPAPVQTGSTEPAQQYASTSDSFMGGIGNIASLGGGSGSGNGASSGSGGISMPALAGVAA